MPLDGHSYLVSQGWSGHGTGLRQDAIIRPLAIPQKRTLSGLGKDRDEAFPFWDHVFSVAAKSIQVKLYKDDDDSSDSDATPKQASLDLTTTGILSNKPPKLGSSALATPASSSSNSGLNTPITTNIPNRLLSSSSSLLVAAKKESAKRMLYSRFFRGPIFGPDSDSHDSCNDVLSGSHSTAAEVKPRIDNDDLGWNSNFNGGGKNGGRTPMAIAKSKLTGTSEAAIPLKKGLEKVRGVGKHKKKRKLSNDDEVEVKRREEEEKDNRKKKDKEGKERERENKRGKKKRKRDEKEGLKEEEKQEKKSNKDKTPRAPAAENVLTQTLELTKASTVPDKSKSIPCSGNEGLYKVRSERKSRARRKEEDDGLDTSEDKEKRHRERKQKRERKNAEKAAAAEPQVTGDEGEGLDNSNTRLISPPGKHSEELHLKPKKKKRKRDE